MPELDRALQETLDEFEDQAANLVKELFGKNGYKTAIRSIFEAFMQSTETDIKKYIAARTQQLISESDFEILLKTKAALLRLDILTAKGLSEVQAERFRRQFMALLTNSLLGLAEQWLKKAIA